MTACQPNTVEDLQPAEPEIREFPLVDERLWPYFERFEAEAKERGESVDLVASRISGKIEAIDQEHVAGLCTTFGNARPGSVTIDAEFWSRANDLFKEFKDRRCNLCNLDYIQECSSFTTANKKVWNIKCNISCQSENVLYYLTCNSCS